MSGQPKILLIIRAVVFDGEKMLLIRRSASASYEPGCWEIPGGKLDIGQSIPEAIQREVREETGLVIKVKPGDVILTFSGTRADRTTKYKGYYLLTLVFGTGRFSSKLRLSSEHDDSRWVTLKGAPNLKLTETTEKILNFLTR